MGIKDIHV